MRIQQKNANLVLRSQAGETAGRVSDLCFGSEAPVFVTALKTLQRDLIVLG
jgi:hypothetical protein